jgi:hypothetical protein
LPEDLAVYTGDQGKAAVSLAGKLFSNFLRRGERYSDRPGHGVGGRVDAVNSLMVFWFAAADDQVAQAVPPSSSETVSSHSDAATFRRRVAMCGLEMV